MDKNVSENNDDEQESDNAFTSLRLWRARNKDRLTIGSLNINSLPNKIDDLRTLVTDNVDILELEETKIEDTSSDKFIKKTGYKHKPFRRDRTRRGGGIITYVREEIPSKILNLVDIPNDIKGKFIEKNLRKAKWLIFLHVCLGKIKVIILKR